MRPVNKLIRLAVVLAMLSPFPALPLRAAPPAVVDVHTAAHNVIVVVVQTGPHLDARAVPNPVDVTPASWRVDGAAPAAIHRYSVPWDEEKLGSQGFPVYIRHFVYLRLAQPLEQGRSYAISTPYGAAGLTFDARSTFCESIKVNQVGYSKRTTSRYANLGVFMGEGGSMTFSPVPSYQVISEATGGVVASGTAVYMGDDTRVAEAAITSGEHVYRLPLNNVPDGGPYYVSIPGFGRSRSFGVGDTYTARLAYVITRGLFHQRCGIALDRAHTTHNRAICHPRIAYGVKSDDIDGDDLIVPAGSPTAPIRGGFHDAGDCDHLPTHSIISILMLSYFEAWPTHFTDGQYDIPESGNGVPDFLDETMWGVLLWENLQIMDTNDPQYGAVLGGWSTRGYPAYGGDSAASDNRTYGSIRVVPDHTAFCAGIFAQASRLIRPYDQARADALLNRARLAWDFLARTTNVNAYTTSNMYASLQLYLATGEPSHHDIFRAAASHVVPEGNPWPEGYGAGNISAKCQTAHFISYLLPHGRSTDAAVVQTLKNRIFFYADNGTYMGPAPENSPYPQGVTKFMDWGTGAAQGLYADVFAFASLLTTDSGKRQAYINAVSQYSDYSLGLNPMGLSYYTGLGTDQVTSPLHTDSYYTKYGLSDGVSSPSHQGAPKGNVPGLLVMGPSQGRSFADYQMAVSEKLYPGWDALPTMRRYAQGWSLVNQNEVGTLHTIWNVVMFGFLHDAGGTTPPPPPPPSDAMSPARPRGLRLR
jgi:endoglucanase